MYETAEDLAALQDLLDASYAAAGPHLSAIHAPERRLTAPEVAGRLSGMCLLALATVTGDCRPLVGPVDGIFYRGAFHFGSSSASLRLRHLRRRPQVSASHLPGEHLAVTVHGRAVPVDLRAAEHADFRRVLMEVYLPRFGAGWEEFLDTGRMGGEPVGAGVPEYARIDAARMFTFYMAPDIS
ncbi:MAG: hypothetical protein NVSMB32_08170 [Actinomycetota bacterium]